MSAECPPQLASALAASDLDQEQDFTPPRFNAIRIGPLLGKALAHSRRRHQTSSKYRSLTLRAVMQQDRPKPCFARVALNPTRVRCSIAL